jgi:hypothetical protein
LRWEARRLLNDCPQGKVILIMPPVAEEEARQRWEEYRSLFPERFPPYQGGEVAVVLDPAGNFQIIRRTNYGSFWGAESHVAACKRALGG